MNDNELQDRIAARLERGTSCCELCWDSANEVAQAVIEDLGMTTEDMWTTFPIDDPKHLQRVVGKWEQA